MIKQYVENLTGGLDLSQWDQPRQPEFRSAPASTIHQGVVDYYSKLYGKNKQTSADKPSSKTRFSLKKIKAMTEATRQRLDDAGLAANISARIINPTNPAVPGEWVVAPGANPDKRMLYIHGGGFSAGSPRSHRAITNRMAEAIGGAVFAVDYRLIPENPRLACVKDVRNAYLWMIENGPQGSAPATELYIAGDSAGGNLTLGLLPWIRIWSHPKPRAAVAISPITDSTMQSPSIKANLKTDAMLQGIFGFANKIPKPAFKLLGLAMNRTSALDPRISPINYPLHDLPPVLVHASTAECLEDDARRWVNKAQAANSPARLQLWANMVHVWHAFISLSMPESIEAFNEIEKFLRDPG